MLLQPASEQANWWCGLRHRLLKRVHLIGTRNNQNVEHYYEFIDFRPTISAPEVFDVCVLAPQVCKLEKFCLRAVTWMEVCKCFMQKTIFRRDCMYCVPLQSRCLFTFVAGCWLRLHRERRRRVDQHRGGHRRRADHKRIRLSVQPFGSKPRLCQHVIVLWCARMACYSTWYGHVCESIR